jgi:hypothetical protein
MYRLETVISIKIELKGGQNVQVGDDYKDRAKTWIKCTSWRRL